MGTDIRSLGSFVWSIAELLRGDFKQSEYGKVILPFAVLRRLDCMLEPTKTAVLERARTLPQNIDDKVRDALLFDVTGQELYNLSRFTFASLKGQDAKDIHENLKDYINGFSDDVRDIFLEKFRFIDQLKRLHDAGLLYQVFDKFTGIDLHPDAISNRDMGYLFEELIRRFSETSNETAGEHYTPREVIRLIVSLLLINDRDALAKPGVIRRVYDPAAGTGGMLSIAETAMKALNGGIHVELFGQEINPESFAICKSDMLVTGHNAGNIAFGNTLTRDAHAATTGFHYMLSNPPYGVKWAKYADPIMQEAANSGMSGRFGAGLPRVSDGQLLFLQHMISRMRNDEHGSRIGIVMNGSPLFTGGAGSGESEIRRWMLEHDWVEAIIALPTDLFYNTGIQTYIWLLTNRKHTDRVGRVQLIDASGERFWKSMRKSLGKKRREIPPEARDEIVRIYAEMLNGDGTRGAVSRIFATTDFGYREIRVERPLKRAFAVQPQGLATLRAAKPFQRLDADDRARVLAALQDHLPAGARWIDRDEFDRALSAALRRAGVRIGAAVKRAIMSALSEPDEAARVCTDKRGRPEPDPELRDHELVPLNQDWRDYMQREVLPFVPDAWVDEGYTDAQDGGVGRVGYEINFNRYFYQYVPPRPLNDINAELKALEAEIAGLLQGVVG